MAAAIADTPWSIAWVIMWKIGPEWAAQHAKYVSAMAANWGVRSACAAVSSLPSAPAVGSGTAAVAGTVEESSPSTVQVTVWRSSTFRNVASV